MAGRRCFWSLSPATHVAIAGLGVRTDDGWLLHCGDAYFYRGAMDVDEPHCTPGLKIFQQLVVTQRAARNTNQKRLRELKRDHGKEVNLFCSHDHVELENLQGAN